MINIIISLVAIIVVCIIINIINNVSMKKESFGFYDNLWPSRDTYCEERGLNKSYMPQKCIILDECGRIKYWDRYRNCRCVDRRTGLCKTCYPRLNL